MLQNASESQRLDLQQMFPESSNHPFSISEEWMLQSAMNPLFLAARYRDPNKANCFKNWLTTKPADGWRLELTHYLGFSYYNDDKHAKGIN